MKTAELFEGICALLMMCLMAGLVIFGLCAPMMTDLRPEAKNVWSIVK